MSNFQSFVIGFDQKDIDAHIDKLLNGMKPEDAGFSSQEEMLAAMKDARYSQPGPEGEAYRQLVVHMVKNGNISDGKDHNAVAAGQRRADWKAEEDRQILREHLEGLMKDERYTTSALWRRQVRQQIEANPGLFEQGAGPQPTRVKARIQLDGGLEEAQAAIRAEREEKRAAEVKAASERAAKLAARESFDVTRPFGVAGIDDEE